jgi:prepilin-type processing-associated H-X9-DG protein
MPLFLCPSDITTSTFPLYRAAAGDELLVTLPTASYVGVFGTFDADELIPSPAGNGSFLESTSVRFSDLERGLSNTLLVGERTMARVPSTWLGVDYRGEDAACRLVGSAMTSPNCAYCDECEFDSRHSGGAIFVWGDGRAGMVSDKIDTAEYRQLARRSKY